MKLEAFDELSVAIQKMGYDNLNNEIRRTMRRSAKDVIQLGYMLKQMRDKRLWECRYCCLDEYLTQELGIDYTMANRFMNLNSKYSWSGNSAQISERYADYSQGLLIEMLSMPPELEEQVNPGMTVRQVREIKRSAKKKADSQPMVIGESDENVIDGVYREITEKAEIATSQFGETLKARDDEVSKLRCLLEEKKKELEEAIKVDDLESLPEEFMYERKTIVGALASMLFELENAAEQVEEKQEQPELCQLKNNDQRKEWLAKYKDWGLWYRDENIDVNYYKYDFADGSRLVVAEYPQRKFEWLSKPRDDVRYHLLKKNHKGYNGTYDKQYVYGTDSETYLVDFLKNLQKG